MFWILLLGILVLSAFATFINFLGKEYNYLASFSSALILLIAAAVAYRQLQHGHNTRHADIILRLLSTWNSEYMEESRKKLWQTKNVEKAILDAYNNNNEDAWIFLRVANFFELVGFLCSKDSKELLDLHRIKNILEDVPEEYYKLYQ